MMMMMMMAVGGLKNDYFLGINNELTIDVSAFQVAGGGGRDGRSLRNNHSFVSKHHGYKNVASMHQFLSKLYGSLDVEILKSKLGRKFAECCFGICLSVAIQFPDQTRLKKFKHHYERYGKFQYMKLEKRIEDIYKAADHHAIAEPVLCTEFHIFDKILQLNYQRRLVVYEVEGVNRWRRMYPLTAESVANDSRKLKIINIVHFEQQ
jgi:hypothetical protein